MVLTTDRVLHEDLIHICVHMKGQELKLDIKKTDYKHLKTSETQTWNEDVKLVEIAQQLEKELVIVENKPNQYILDWIASYKQMQPNVAEEVEGRLINVEPATPASVLL